MKTNKVIKLDEALLYHGSPNKSLTKLEIGKEKTTGDEFGSGIYLTKDYNEAKGYSGPEGRVYKVSLNNDNLYNLKEPLPQTIKEIVKSELLDNKDIINQIVRYNRKQYEVIDNKTGFEFYKNKKKEWEILDGIYLGNLPQVNKDGNKLIVTYTDYEDIDSAIDKLTGDDLQKILSHNMNPNVFVKLIIKAGYDGIITHNDNWYIIYKNEDCVKIEESKHKVDEASRNELLALAKSQTITRYNKASGYKGFNIVDIDTTTIFTTDTITITCRVGDYFDTVELQDILIWIQMEAERNPNNQVNTKVITQALMEAIDALEIKVDCTCADFCLEENTLIKLLNNEVVTIKELKDKFDNNEELWVYSTDKQGDFKPGKVTNVWISGKANKMIRVTLDNDKEIITTPNHKYMMRDGSYKKAEDLSENDSLMPLYFRYTNGYENVKRNSIVYPTRFDSVYKIVAETVLSKEKQEAKDRTGEDIIQIHHRDFNKLNNYPSNLYPMGKMEHWMYHSKLGGKNIEKLIEAGRRFWVEDPRRFEALAKQKRRASECKKEWWASMSEEEKQKWIADNAWTSTDEGRKIISQKLKEVWKDYSKEEKEARLKTNYFINNNPMTDEEFRNSEEFLKRNKNISRSLNEFHKITTQEQRNKMYGWAKGKTFNEDHKQKISKALIGREVANETKQKLKEAAIATAYKTHTKQINEKRGKTILQNWYNSILESDLTDYEKAYKILLHDMNKLDLSNIELNKRITLGKIKPILCSMYANKENITEIVYTQYKTNKAPKVETINNLFGSFSNMCNLLKVDNSYNHKVKKVEYIYYDDPIDVYDLEVDNYHNFYVDAGVMLHNCYRFAYMATQLDYKYGKPENRPAKITNPHDYGSICKHLIAMLSNKKWLQQVSGTIMDFIEKNIDKVNEYLRPKEGMELTLPNELARKNAKTGFYSKLFKDKLEEPNEEDNEEDIKNDEENTSNNNSNNIDNSNNRDNINNNEEEEDMNNGR